MPLPPSPAQSFANGFSEGQSIGAAIRERHRRKKLQRLNDLSLRYNTLARIYENNRGLLQDASARGDTAGVRQLTESQAELLVQLQAISDTAAKVAR